MVYSIAFKKGDAAGVEIGRDQYNEKLQTMATAGEMPDCGMVAKHTVIA